MYQKIGGPRARQKVQSWHCIFSGVGIEAEGIEHIGAGARGDYGVNRERFDGSECAILGQWENSRVVALVVSRCESAGF